MQGRNVLLLLCISIAPSAEAVHTIRGLRTDDSKKIMKMSHKSHKMAKKSSKSSKGTTATSEVDDCSGLSDGSSETPYGNSTSESPGGNRRMLKSVVTEIVFDYEPYKVTKIEVAQLAYAVGAGTSYGGVVNFFPEGEKAYIQFRIDRVAKSCVADWFGQGLSDDNMLALFDPVDLDGNRATRPGFMYFSAVLNIVITLDNYQQIRFNNLRVGETYIKMKSLEFSYIDDKIYWWIGGDQCSKKSSTSLICLDATGAPRLLARGYEANTILT